MAARVRLEEDGGGEARRRHAKSSSMVPLALLIGEEARMGKMERPRVRYGCAAQSKKGEDYFLIRTDCQRVAGDTSSCFSVFAILENEKTHGLTVNLILTGFYMLVTNAYFRPLHQLSFSSVSVSKSRINGVLDGHNGNAAAIYTRDNLLNHVMSAIPRQTSGTTVTFVIIDGWTITVASVGDSRCILDAQGGVVSSLTVDHRLEENVEEWVLLLRERVTASGGEVGRLSIVGGAQIGPLRCWPGGLCLSRSIGDMDVGEFIVPVPYVKQVKLSNTGGRLIIASDGIWDALTSEMAANSCRGLPAELAARLVVKEALRTRGLKDDTTCIVVDIAQPDHSEPPQSTPKKVNKFKSFIFRKSSKDSTNKLAKKLSAVGIVEEIFEEGSAMLSERLGSDSSAEKTWNIFTCAICQTHLAPSEGVSVHAGSIFSTSSKPWEGPFLCADCRIKKDAMEGKRPSGVKVL
ncbi:hypothetical protein ZIOFF_039764 [Zingiber officinale]|uniref:protein-serine/threonine phosphatase n=1 Tax=Zingiber officinale TaxID=94328 RepID=A0A8J5G3U6_ZINOF|nr:hypothetical protein ZIOFF_039764 [Zingiber officinale]